MFKFLFTFLIIYSIMFESDRVAPEKNVIRDIPSLSILKFGNNTIGGIDMAYQKINQNFSIKFLSNEIWKDIPDYEGYYQISNLGRVKSLSRKMWNGRNYWESKEKIMKHCYYSNNYTYIGLWKNNKSEHFMLHKLIMLVFIGECEEGMEIDHKNGIKDDNRLENLESVTSKENKRRAWELGLYNNVRQAVSKRQKNKIVSIETKNKMSISGKKAWIKRKEKLC